MRWSTPKPARWKGFSVILAQRRPPHSLFPRRENDSSFKKRPFAKIQIRGERKKDVPCTTRRDRSQAKAVSSRGFGMGRQGVPAKWCLRFPGSVCPGFLRRQGSRLKSFLIFDASAEERRWPVSVWG